MVNGEERFFYSPLTIYYSPSLVSNAFRRSRVDAAAGRALVPLNACALIILHLLVIQLVLLFVKLFGHAPVVEGPVDGVNVRVEDHVVEMPDDDGERRKHSFVEVHRERNVNPPSCKEAEHA